MQRNGEEIHSMSFRHVRPRSLALGLLAAAVPTAVVLATVVPSGTALASGGGNEFQQTNLISNRSDQGAQVVDPGLQNAWGLAMSATSPLWVSDNNSGLATVYRINAGGTTAVKVPLNVTVPGGRVSTNDGSSPSGQVFNPTTGFVVTTTAGSGPGLFIFDSESGQISAWNPAADPVSSTGMSTATLTAAMEPYLPIIHVRFLLGPAAGPALRERLIRRVEAALRSED